MKTVLAAAVLALCLAFAGHAAEPRPIAAFSAPVAASTAPIAASSVPIAASSVPTASCIQHGFVRVSATTADQAASLGCAQFLSTSRVVQPRHIQRT